MTIRNPLGTTETLAVLAVILAAAAFLRLWSLGAESLWLDEAHSVIQAQRWWKDIWVNDARSDPNPPFYFSVLRVWMHAFGTSEVAVRSLSVACGLLAIVGIYLFGHTAGGPRLALAAAALASTSPWLVIYSRDTRGYALATAAATFSLYGALKLFAHERLTETALAENALSRRTLAMAWAAYVGGGAVAMYTHATLILLPILTNLAFAILWLGHGQRDWRVATRWLAGNAILALLWLPWVPNVIAGDVVAGTFWVPPVSKYEALTTLREVDGHVYLWALQPWLDLAILVVGLVGIISLAPSRAAALLCVAAVVFVPFLTWLVSLARPIFLARVLIWPLPFLCVLLAAGVLKAPRQWMSGVAILALLGVQIASLNHIGWTRFHEPWRDLVAQLRSERQPGDSVVIVPSFAAMPYEYYAGPDDHTWPVAVGMPAAPGPHWTYTTIASDALPARTAGSQRIWLIVRRQPAEIGINGLVDQILRESRPTLRFRERRLELYLLERP